MTHPNRQTHPTPGEALRAYLDTLPPPTLEQIAETRLKVMARRQSDRGVA